MTASRELLEAVDDLAMAIKLHFTEEFARKGVAAALHVLVDHIIKNAKGPPMPTPAELAALSEAATPGTWEVQDGCSWRRIGTREHDGNVLHPVRTWHDGHPDLSCGKGEDLCANLNLIVALVNAYRTGDLVLIDRDGMRERVGRSIEAVSHHNDRDIWADAAIAAILGGYD